MAGRRHYPGQPSRPLRRAIRAENRRAMLADRMARAETPAQRVSAACDYTRQILATLPPAEAGAIADELCRVLVDTVAEAERRQIAQATKERKEPTR